MADAAKGAFAEVSEGQSDASLTGGCQCGAVRYLITGTLHISYACHCRECQKQSASGFGISVPVKRAHFAVSGPLQIWSRQTDSGSVTDCYFCPQCGTRVYHAGSGRAEWVTVKGGSLDRPDALQPAAHIWIRSRQRWFDLPDHVPHWETQPRDEAEWKRMVGWDE